MPVLNTVREVDDALGRARRIPEDERGDLWQAIVDELLERRVALDHADTRLAALMAERKGS